jgi:methionyl-tRNA formyltransferase
MKIIFLTNNDITKPLSDWLKLEEEVIILSEKLKKELVLDLKPDFIISYNYKYIIKEELINLFPGRIINLHTSLLPWNRGASPNIWSFLKNTPKGVTIHLIDKGIDTGPILARKEVFMDENRETLASSFNYLHQQIQELFRENWPRLKNFEIAPVPQDPESGSTNFLKDLKEIEDLFGGNWDTPVRELMGKYKELTPRPPLFLRREGEEEGRDIALPEQEEG